MWTSPPQSLQLLLFRRMAQPDMRQEPHWLSSGDYGSQQLHGRLKYSAMTSDDVYATLKPRLELSCRGFGGCLPSSWLSTSGHPTPASCRWKALWHDATEGGLCTKATLQSMYLGLTIPSKSKNLRIRKLLADSRFVAAGPQAGEGLVSLLGILPSRCCLIPGHLHAAATTSTDTINLRNMARASAIPQTCDHSEPRLLRSPGRRGARMKLELNSTSCHPASS